MKKLTMLLLVLVIVAGWCWASTSGDPATKLNQPQPGSQLSPPHPGSKLPSAKPGHRAVLPGFKTPSFKTALPVPLSEDFEGATFPPVGWSLTGPASLWSRSTDCSGYGIGTASALSDFYSVSSGYQDLITLTFDPTTAADTLQFDHAYATYVNGERDSLAIYTSTDGGTTWTLLVGLGGGTDGPLNTGGSQSGIFVPTSSQWATKDFALPIGTNAAYFRAVTAYGNELYLDNIRMKPHAMAHDVGVFAIRSPGSMVTPNTPLTPRVVYSNPGLNTETNFRVGCFVDSSGSIVYQDSSLVASLAVGDTDAVSFSNWTPGPAGANYTFTTWCRLIGDLNNANDTLNRTTTSFAILTTLMAPRGTAPTIDGVINTSEWADANKYDISDVLGNGGGDPGGSPPGSAFLYLKNDSTHLYVAVDNNFGSSADYDQVGLYFDDNHNQAWSADSSEGNYWWVYVGAGNRIIYRYIPQYGLVEPVPGMTVAISTSSGHQQYEGFVQIGLKPPNPNWWLNANIGDTVGFYLYSQFNGTVQRGWWPQAMPNAAWNDPTQYGNLVLGQGPSGVEIQQPVKGQVVAALYASMPNPVRGNATISYSIPNGTEVSLKVYDAMGRLVRTLASGTRDAGIHNVSLDANRLASGVYFYHLQAGGFSATRKLVVAR